jgi:hypothetical protein
MTMEFARKMVYVIVMVDTLARRVMTIDTKNAVPMDAAIMAHAKRMEHVIVMLDTTVLTAATRSLQTLRERIAGPLVIRIM